MFQDVGLSWNSKDYTIPADRVLSTIAIIEEYFSMNELATDLQTKNIKLVKLSSCMAHVLNSAGCEVSREDVYESLFIGSTARDNAMKLLQTLMVMMVPPEYLKIKTPPVTGTGTGRGTGTRGKRKPKQKSGRSRDSIKSL